MPTWSELLCGRHRPELEAPASAFLQGYEPLRPPLLQKLWRELQDGQQEMEDGDPILVACLRAIQDPASVAEWSAELRQGDHFAGFLARLLEWTELLDWMDTAPPGQEVEVERQMPRARRLGQWLEARHESNRPLRAWFLREKARLVGLEGGDPLPWIERSLQQAAHLQQWREVAQVRVFLQFSGSEGISVLSNRQKRELAPLLAAVPELAGAPGLNELRRGLLSSLLQLIPMEAALWLEKDGDWEVKEWAPRHISPRYSHRLVETCHRTQELTWGQPEQLEASRSLLLSEVRSLVALPIGKDGVLFAWQSAAQEWLTQDQIEALQFLARLGSQLQSNLALSEQIGEDLLQAQRLHRRWQRIFHDTPGLALAELDDEGRLLDWNQAFRNLFGEVAAGTSASQLLPEPERHRDLEGLLQLSQEEARSRLIRLGGAQEPCWVQITDWRVPDQPGFCRAVLDVSRHDVAHWFDYLEELRHRLASDLHDGPAQMAAALQLSEGGQQSREVYASLRNRLDFLRSPWIEQRDPETKLADVLRQYLPYCQVDWEARTIDLSRSQQQFLQRVWLGVIETLSTQAPPQQIRVGSTWLEWSPSCEVHLEPSFQHLVECGLEVLGGSWECRAGRFEVSLQPLTGEQG